MTIDVKNLYVIPLLLFGLASPCLAQVKSDTIYKVDLSLIPAIIDEVSQAELVYYLPSDAARKSKVSISRAKVWKVVYASGEIEVINTVDQPQAGTDKLFLKDGTVLGARVVEVSEDSVKYMLGANVQKQLHLKEIEKIIYANGMEQ